MFTAPYLVAVGGELYIPAEECSAGSRHYTSYIEDGFKIDIDPTKPASWHLRVLIGRLKRLDEYGEPTERVNLLYEKDGDALDLDIGDFLRSGAFDFFVSDGTPGSMIRFQYFDGKIYVDGKHVSLKTPPETLFRDMSTLELTHISYPGADFVATSDYAVVDKWSSMEDDRKKREITGKIAEIVPGYDAEGLGNLGLMDFYVLLSVASDDEPVPDDEIMEHILDDDYHCRCSVDDDSFREGVEESIQKLTERGIIVDISNEYVMPFDAVRGRYVRELKELTVGLETDSMDDTRIGILSVVTREQFSYYASEIHSLLDGMGFDIRPGEVRVALSDLVRDKILVREEGLLGIAEDHIRYGTDQYQMRLPFDE